MAPLNLYFVSQVSWDNGKAWGLGALAHSIPRPCGLPGWLSLLPESLKSWDPLASFSLPRLVTSANLLSDRGLSVGAEKIKVGVKPLQYLKAWNDINSPHPRQAAPAL